MALPVARRRFTADEYERMAEAGILGEDDRVELLEGDIVEMAPIGPLHAGCVNRLVELFKLRVGERAIVSAQNPVRLDQGSEPQPDVALLRRREDFYSTGHPQPGDVLLIVEVALATASFDRLVKIPMYAASGIAQSWLVDLDRQVIEIYRVAAGGGAYGQPELVSGSQRVAIDAFPDVLVEAREILG